MQSNLPNLQDLLVSSNSVYPPLCYFELRNSGALDMFLVVAEKLQKVPHRPIVLCFVLIVRNRRRNTSLWWSCFDHDRHG